MHRLTILEWDEHGEVESYTIPNGAGTKSKHIWTQKSKHIWSAACDCGWVSKEDADNPREAAELYGFHVSMSQDAQ